jgi:hypothetical protein
MLFTMLSGEVPPGALRVTPAVERLVQRALDTDTSRRYKSAADLLENLLEAMEDDRWELADRGELIREAGLSATDENIDDATEDLLASLGSGGPVQVSPLRPSMDLRAEAAAMKKQVTPTGGRLDALLAEIGDDTGMTKVDEPPSAFRRDPISEVIRSNRRVPSLDDPDDDHTPLPPPGRDSVLDLATIPRRSGSTDEHAALAAIDSLDEGAKRVTTAAEQAAAAAAKLEQVAARAERAAKRAESEPRAPASRPIVMPEMTEVVTPRLRSPLVGVLGGLLVLGTLGVGAYFVYHRFQEDAKQEQAAKERNAQDEENKKKEEARQREALPDPGAIDVTAEGAGIWLRLGKTPLDTAISLPANQQHDMVLIHDGYEPTEAQINGTTWTGSGKSLAAKLSVTLKQGKKPADIPLQPTTPVLGTTGIVGAGKVHVDSAPADADVWLFIGANHAHFENLWAGRDYEVAVVKPGFKTQHVLFKVDDWRDGGDPTTPIDSAKKKDVLSKTVELEPDPTAKKGK